MSLVEFSSISKSFEGDVVLSDLDFAVEEGDFAVIYGLSGAGKSVLLRMVVGLETPDEGGLTLRGSNAAEVKPGDRKIGYVPQSFALFPDKTVAENVAYPLTVAGESKHLIAESVEAATSLLDISELLDRRPDQLSGGQKQRVAIARGLALGTDLYVLDDPLVGLDFKLREKLIDDLRETREVLGVTFLYATADATEALALANKVAVLADGAIQEYGAPRDIYARPNHLATMSTLCFPQSNRLPATFEDGEITTPWGSVAASMNGSTVDPDDFAAMVRPEHVELRPEQGRVAVGGHATVMLREDLGAEEIVYLEIDGHQLTSLVRADSADLEALTLGETVEFGIPAEAIVIFSGGRRTGQGRS
ncbi:MAG: ABC transporter ATP-binding protein [Actinomycetota bacterium]